MVAFSGEVTDDEFGTEAFTEPSVNAGLKGRTLPEAFSTTRSCGRERRQRRQPLRGLPGEAPLSSAPEPGTRISNVSVTTV